jgi:hypothetical protein
VAIRGRSVSSVSAKNGSSLNSFQKCFDGRFLDGYAGRPGASLHHIRTITDDADVLVMKHTSRYPCALRFSVRVKILYLESTIFNSLSTPT